MSSEAIFKVICHESEGILCKPFFLPAVVRVRMTKYSYMNICGGSKKFKEMSTVFAILMEFNEILKLVLVRKSLCQ